MNLKLEEIRNTVKAHPYQYPTAYHLAVNEGVYDVGELESAMAHDFYQYEGKSELPLDPFNYKAKITKKDLLRDELHLAELDGLATELAEHCFKRHDLKSAQQAIRFIQSHGRNSQAAKTLVAELQPKPANPVPITKLFYVETRPNNTKAARKY